MHRWRDHPAARVTLVSLSGSLALVGAGTAGLTGSPWLVLALLAAAVPVRLLGRAALDTAWGEFDHGQFVADLWLGPVVAAVFLAAFLDATAGELQALGGLLGLTGMANYFLRPVYYLLYGLFSRLAAV